MLIVTARAKAKRGSEAKLHNELMQVSKATKSEPGCVSYRVYRDAQDATVVMVHEIWKSEADMQTHLQKPYVQHLFSLVPQLCDGVPEMKTWTPLD